MVSNEAHDEVIRKREEDLLQIVQRNSSRSLNIHNGSAGLRRHTRLIALNEVDEFVDIYSTAFVLIDFLK